MKRSSLLFILLVCSFRFIFAQAGEVLYMGRYYHDVTVESVEGTKAKIHSTEGDAEIPLSALPPILQRISKPTPAATPRPTPVRHPSPAFHEPTPRPVNPAASAPDWPFQSAAWQGRSTHPALPKVVFAPGEVRLRGHIAQKFHGGLLVDCPDPAQLTGTASANPAATEPTAYGTFFLKNHPMETYLVNQDPVNVIAKPIDGIFTSDGQNFRVYEVTKADAR